MRMVDYRQDSGQGGSRAGKDFRTNTDRFFHVMGQGWYVLTREGTSGPYLTRELANEFVQDLVNNTLPESRQESWRYKPV